MDFNVKVVTYVNGEPVHTALVYGDTRSNSAAEFSDQINAGSTHSKRCIFALLDLKQHLAIALHRLPSYHAANYRLDFGKHCGKKLYEVPVSYLNWVLDTFDDKPYLRIKIQEFKHEFLNYWTYALKVETEAYRAMRHG